MNKEQLSVIEKLRSHWQRRVINENLDAQLNLYIPTMLGYIENEVTANRLSGVDEVQKFLENDKKVMLLLGDSGAGKSLFGLWLVKHLWEKDQGIIPIFIHLPLLGIKTGFIERYLKNYCELEEQEIKELKTQHRILFVLDSYDEMKSKYKGKNVHKIGELFKWNVQILISCRTESLVSYSALERLDMFEPYSADRKMDFSIEIRHVQAFDSRTQVPEYIQLWKQLNPQKVDPKIDYLKFLTTLRHVSEMITNPFILWIVLLSLPEIFQKHADEKILQKIHLTRLSLFDVFTTAWFKRQREKMVRNGLINDKSEWNDIDLNEDDFRLYCEQLANVMWQRNMCSVKYEAKEKFCKSKTTLSRLRTQSYPENAWDVFFAPAGLFNGDSKKPLHLVRSGALLRVEEGNTYSFLHESLNEYFSAKNMFESAANKASIVLGLEINTQLFVDDRARIRLGADCVQDNPEFEEALWEILEESKHDPLVSTAAANAATILAAADRSFAGRDLSRIRIRYANVYGGNFDGTNLQESDLRNTIFSQTWLNKANFSGALLDGIEFGELISDNQNSEVQGCEFTKDGKFYIVLTKTSLIIFEAHSHKIVNTYQPNLRKLGYVGEFLRCFAIWQQGDKLIIGTNYAHLILISLPNCRPLSEWQRVSDPSNFRDHKLSWYRLNWLRLDSHDEYVFAACDMDVGVFKVNNKSNISVQKKSYIAGRLTCHILSPSRSWALSGTEAGIIYRWDFDVINKPKEYLRQANSSPVTALAISPNELWAFSGSGNSIIKWGLASGRCLDTWTAYTIIRCIVVSPNGRFIFTGGDDHSVRIWDESTGACLRMWQGHSGTITSLAVSLDASWVLSGSQDQTIKRWKIEFEHNEQPWVKKDKLSMSRAISPDGCWAATSFHNKITLWKIGLGLSWENVREDVIEENGKIESLSVTSDGICAFIFVDNRVYHQRKILCLWELKTGNLVPHYKKRTLTKALTISPNADVLIFGTENGGMKCLRTMGGSVICLQKEQYQKSSLTHRAFYHVGKWLESKFSDSDTSDSESQEELRSRDDPNKPVYEVTSLAFSHDGSWVLVGAEFNTVKIWNVEKKQFTATWSAHTDKVIAFGISHCERWVLSAGEDYKLILWECSGGTIRWENILPQKVEAISWSKNNLGKVILGMNDGSFSIWEFNYQTFSLHLVKRSNTWGLYSNQCRMLGIYGLPAEQLRVLERKGAQVQLSAKPTQELIDKRFNIEAIYDPQVPITSVFDSTTTLRPEAWAVSIVRKKKWNQNDSDVGKHVFLVVESIEDGYYRIRQIDFFIELRIKHSSAFGQGLIEVTNKCLCDMQVLVQQCFARTSGITTEQGQRLLNNIRGDQSRCIGYNLAGAGNMYRMFRIKEATEHHNCLSWCEKHLDDIGVNLIQKKWIDGLVNDPSIKLKDDNSNQKSPRKPFSLNRKDLTDSEDRNNSEKCLMM